MVKKLQKLAAKKKPAVGNGFADALGGALPAGLLDNHLAQAVKDSAQQIWAAGLGAFSKAQGEGGKVFEALVKEGLNLQKKTQSAAETKLSAVASKVTGMAGDVGAKAGQHWDKLESIFEERVARALNRLGVPSAKDIDSLIARIDALSVAVGVAPAKAPAKKKTEQAVAAKPAAKKVATKAAPAKAEPKAPAKKTAVKAAAKKVAPKAAPKVAPKAPAKKAVAKKAAPAAPAAETASPQA
ncbi:phasin family protein [Paucibacter soli]|uniref:phasin family protein n=1 Tax=Paucibacter soli TaxID=3133433 RepID=UPI0030B10AD1